MRSTLGALALLSLLTGCAAAPHTRGAGAVAKLDVRPVIWNAQNAPVGKVRAVADGGDVVCVLADEGATVLSSKAVVAHDEGAKGWSWGGTIYSADGDTTWVAGVDRAGHLQRLRGMSSFEDVTARYGVGDKRVLGASMTGPATFVLFLEREIALASGEKTIRYATDPFRIFAGGGRFIAWLGRDELDLVNTTNGHRTRFALPGVTHTALDESGRLYAATKRAIYAADASGALSLVYDAAADDLHGLVASRDRVWFADGNELGVVQNDHVAETNTAAIARDAALTASPSGDVWVIAGGKLQRFEVLGATASAPTWSSMIGPIFARSCSACHQPNGVSGIDLSNEAAWTAKREQVRERVLVSRTMPPQGHVLSDADREAIHAWITKR